MGIASFVLGIVGIVLSCIGIGGILGLVGLPLGIISLISKKRKAQSIVGIILCSLAILVSVLMFFIVPTNKETVETSSETEQTVTEEKEEKKVGKKEYSIGENFQNSNVVIKFISSDTDFKGYSRYATVKDGYKIIKAEFEFENIGYSDFYASTYDFDCYADGYACEAFYSVDDEFLSSTLSSGKKAKGNVYFEVPIDATSITLEYELNMWTDNRLVFRIV